MVEAISHFFLETVGREWCVFLCSMIPIIELRGAIPLGAGLGLSPALNYALSVLGNMLPVPVILLCIRGVLHWMKHCPVALFSKVALWLENKAEKNRAKVEKYAFWGLFLFVAVPLPGTGAWTGSLVAALMRMNFWRALVSVLLGVLSAGIIMSFVSYGAVALFQFI